MNILITGGASGLGEAITKKLAEDQNNKIFFTFSKSKAKAVSITTEFSNTVSILCDFSDSLSVKLLRDSIEHFDLDVLINNAYSGEFLKSHFHKIAPEEFIHDFINNILPVIEITQEAINSFRKKKQGKIITVLTAALVNVPPIGSSVYIANKAYLEKLTKVWATENAKFNITSNAVSPSFMQTNMTADFDERLLEQIRENHPLKKLLTVKEVAETVKFLIDSSAQINGENIVMNSGMNTK